MGEELAFIRDATTRDPAYERTSDRVFVPLGAISPEGKSMMYDTAASHQERVSAWVALRMYLATRYGTIMNGRHAIQQLEIRNSKQSAALMPILEYGLKSVVTDVAAQGRGVLLEELAEELPFVVYYPDSITLAEAVNAVVLSVGVVPIGHVSGKKGLHGISFDISYDFYKDKLVGKGKGINIGGTLCVVEELCQRETYGYIFVRGVPSMGDVRRLVQPEIEDALCCHRVSASEERNTVGGIVGRISYRDSTATAHRAAQLCSAQRLKVGGWRMWWLSGL